jgi:hypothetical protein
MVCFALLTLLVAPLGADEGWLIERLDILYDIQRDGTIRVTEAIDVDFRSLSKHGIFRDIARRQIYDGTSHRSYAISLISVVAADGRKHQAEVQNVGDLKRFRIGDPDREISGKQTYRITYTLGGVLNTQASHDEFYWNATGNWPVTMAGAVVRVRVPDDGIERVGCFEGPSGATAPCRSTFSGREATLAATRALREGEQLTVVVGFRKGLVSVPPPSLSARPRNLFMSFERTPPILAAMVAGFFLSIGGVWTLWWRLGRDRRFVALQRASGDGAEEERIPLFGGRPVAVEFQPP